MMPLTFSFTLLFKLIDEEICNRLSEYQLTEAESAQCIDFVKQFYNEKLQQRNRYLETWKVQYKKASETIEYLDEQLENKTMSPERYKARVAKHEATQVRTQQLIESTSQDAERWLELAIEVFSSTVNLGEILMAANDAERRQLMLRLGSNWTLSNKKVVLTVREPLNALHI